MTAKLSSIVVVPPAESMIRFPVDVSISLLSVTPIWILSIEAPPFVSSSPDTVKLSVTFPVPPAESIVKLPDDVSISLSPVTPIRILTFVAPLQLKSPLTTTLS